MNCQRFQDLLEEYLDEALPPAGHAAASQHVARCAACHEVLERRQGAGRALSDGFRQITRPLKLQAKVQQRVLHALPTVSAARDAQFRCWFSGRLAWPLAAAACFLVVGTILYPHFTGPRSHELAANSSPDRVPPASASIQVSYRVPTYTFQKDESFVRDSLVYQTVVVSGRLWPGPNQNTKSKD